MSDNNSSSGTSATGLFLGVATLAAGAYNGFCDAQGIPIEKENLEYALVYGPTLVRGAFGAVTGGLIGTVGGGALGAGSGYRDSALEVIAKGGAGAVAGGVGGAVVVGGLSAAVAALQTVCGYAIGYGAGYILN